MKFKVYDNHIVFDFKKDDLTPDIKNIFSMVQANVTEGSGIFIDHSKIADLNIHEIKQLGLPPVYPYRLSINTKGRPTTSAFSYEMEFLNDKSQKFYQVKRQGVILHLDGQSFTLTNPHFGFLEKISKLTPEIKNPGERLGLWSEVIKIFPREVKMDHPELLNVQFVKADRFCVDKKHTPGADFNLVPELVYSKEKEEGDDNVTSQLPEGVSWEFKDSFLNSPTVDPYYRVGNYYIKLSDTLRQCLKVIKQQNQQPLEKKQAFYSSPMSFVKDQLQEDVPENLLEEVFFETEQFKSDRISHIGKWMPKLGLYVDPDAKSPWFPKDDVIVRIKDQLLHFAPDDISQVISDMEMGLQKGKQNHVYQNQTIPLNKDTIQILKEVKNNIVQEAQKYMPPGRDANKQSLLQNLNTVKDREVAVIKDNIDVLQYQKARAERKHYRKQIPGDISALFSEYPHQKEGVLWLEDHFLEGGSGCLLADDMGLGKTFQTLAFLYWYKQQVKDKKPVLIVAPTGLLKNWQDEHKKHLQTDKNGTVLDGLGVEYRAYGPSFRQARKSETNRSVIQKMKDSGYTLTTYESVRDHHKDFFIKVKWGVVVFDEVQKIKNPNSLMTDACKALASDFSIGLTGTPIENSFIDLWCISDCLEPKILGLLKDFHESYIKNKKPNAGYEINKKLVKEKKPPFLLRRLKKGHLLQNLPQREFIIKNLPMTEEQQKAYSEVVRKVKNREYSHSLQALPLLRRYSTYVEDCVAGVEKFIKSSSKMEFLFKTLEEIKTKMEKALICVENRYLQKKIKGICDSRWNLCVSVINGEMAGDRRKQAVDELSEKEGFDVMIISPRAGGVGLNIVSANHIIHIDRWWNPAVEDQSNDRIFRIGQNKPVFVYHLLGIHPYYQDTSFDVELHRLLEKKRQLREETLSPSEPQKMEKEEFYRRVFGGEEMYPHNKNNFYDSEEWQQLRKQIFGKYPPVCMRCGNKNNLHVDHVKPRCKYPDRELDFSNLQILCRDCNMLKGTEDSPDWDFRKSLKSA